ncbi:MAG: hypothetical protein OXC30_00945 [Alphaproteobacteria bacterium]|nr:hypothetical protein [Alphaproteobacteria bacterium]
MLVLLLALVCNAIQCANKRAPQSVEVKKHDFSQLETVSIEDLDKLWERYKRGNKKAQKKYESMRNLLSNRLAKKFKDQAEINRTVLLSWILYAMIQDTSCKFIDKDTPESRAKVLSQPHDFAAYDFYETSDGSSATNLFMETTNLMDIEGIHTDYLFLFSLPHMQKVHIVFKKPRVMDRVFMFCENRKTLLYVDRSITDFRELSKSLVAQMIISPLRDPHSSFPSVSKMKDELARLQDAANDESMKDALARLKDAKNAVERIETLNSGHKSEMAAKRKERVNRLTNEIAEKKSDALKSLQSCHDCDVLSCGYFLSLFLPYYAPDVRLHARILQYFWSDIESVQWIDQSALCGQHPHLHQQLVHTLYHEQEYKDLKRILLMSGGKRDAFLVLRRTHPAHFLW